METYLLPVDHPGEVIKEELAARGWSQRDLAYVLGIAEQQLNPILTGKRAITPDMARALGAAFDVSPEFFANLQKQFDLSRAKEPDPAVKLRASLQAVFPLREMIRRGWIEDSDPGLLELQVVRFFEAQDLAAVPKLGAAEAAVQFAAKRTHYEEDPAPDVAWLYRVRQLARAMTVSAYDENALRTILSRLRRLITDPEAISEVPQMLSETGVRFVVVEWLPGMKVDGVCTWLDDVSPVIGITTLHDRLDNFWFVVRHEIEHVLRGHGKDHAVIDSFDDIEANNQRNVAEEEEVANAAAATFAIPRERMDSFFARKEPFISERDVIGLASVMEVHPAIVVGQIQHRRWMLGQKNAFAFLRKYQVPIRRYLVESAMIDGWGNSAPAQL